MSTLKIKQLRARYPIFIYENFEWSVKNKALVIRFCFKVSPSLIFRPVIKILKINRKRIENVSKEVIDNLVFHLGMIELFSYWKATCSPQILIKAGFLNSEQIKWWQKVLFKGMGQFFYENGINSRKNFVQIKALDKEEQNVFWPILNGKNVLVALGGGKDSLVTLELLKKTSLNIYGFVLNPGSIARKILNKAELKNVVMVQRTIDPALLSLNKKGFLNGHTPFSAYLAFLAVLAGVLFDIKYLFFSNEKSSQEHNVVYHGRKINHQWSKTLEFENMLKWYAKKYLARDIEYSSPVRKLYELQIAEIFSKLPKYHSVFVSCNRPYQIKGNIDRWCGQCPKCLSTYILLAPFLNPEELKNIFGQDLFQKPGLKKILKQLLDEKGIKPFECVGTFRELRVALYLTLKKYDNKKKPLPFLLTFFKRYIMPNYPAIDKESKRLSNLMLGPA